MLKLELRVGESVRIGNAVVTLDDKSGKIARLSIQADRSVPIERLHSKTPAHFAKAGIAPLQATA